jgi:DNA-binding response OmpR family regulator
MDLISNTANKYSGNETILIVDDETALRNMLHETLSNYGYRLLQASSAEHALNFLKSNAIDLLISDVAMPEMDGYQLAHKVNELYPHVKVQLVSGYSDKVEGNKVLHKKILYKPYNTVELLKRIRDILDN